MYRMNSNNTLRLIPDYESIMDRIFGASRLLSNFKC